MWWNRICRRILCLIHLRFHLMSYHNYDETFCEIKEFCNTWINQPERVFGLQVRYKELDIFKILQKFWDIFWKFFGFFWEFFGNFLGGFLGGIFLEEFFGKIFLEEFFLRGFFWEDFFGRIFLGGFFGRIFLRGILWEELLSRN